ncbi:hypothetical protein AAZX31_05G177500 [Glycine max]|uniref:DUF506 family protein n=2 Tax=Glycine subgen. Soja TaxID=1462606 RepID=I1K4X6_SOYBN|nr:uncharacterized protein LOC100782815 isoform 2 [Glycine max]XP_028233278.1 uncharacterized protein LOC114413212 isoform X2 [Glycine soja]KAG5029802.1 hypothetical protein JHK87_013316 [Glycine soja]KAG5041280.1 hypothetical protein JHK85_013756 [Glycine max]KAG5155419.1 hypothetical protein JHK82_013388 [Glycine max]KAH1135209.1 hypothetical protein GYH30_013134 [Glycine max]KHN34063.1 hypothetical protein glysoja_030517 [Glycine soja]|eukprot:NP_001349293.1 uncharacterized protein LOC100782815 isoform 2 [Glycine max]
MGSLEEDELVQMVQDFIESESTSPTSSTSSNCHTLNHRTQYFILQDILRSDGDTACEAKVLKCVLKHMRGRKGAEKTTSLSRWLVMRMKMDGLNASICHTSWATSLGCPAGEYEYIEVITEDDENYAKPMRLIVDIDFRSQFEVARPTQHYKELTDSVPVIFVAIESKLCKIISLLCSAAKQCLREKGLHVPPWRTTSYMQAKWLSVSPKEPSHAGYVGEKGDAIGDDHEHADPDIIGNWVPPLLKPKKRDLDGGGSGLSSQLSNMSVNCC